MDAIGEQGSRALDATADLVNFLKLAQEAAHHIEQEIHADSYDDVHGFSEKLHELRHQAEQLNTAIFQHVKDIENAN